MKTLKHLIACALTATLLAAHSPVKAGDHRGHGDGSLYSGASDKWHNYNDDNSKKGTAGNGSGSVSPGSPNLPINDYAWALAIFGTAIGVKFITDRIKFAKS